MEEKYKDKYRTTPARLTGWDYGSNGLYFTTICTKDRVRYFGEIIQNEIPVETHDYVSYPQKEKDNHMSLRVTPIGDVVKDYWLQISNHFPFVELDEFVIMPDHIHGILFINKPDKNDWAANQFGPQSRNLASIIRSFKSSVKRYANLNEIDFAWQAGYHDRVIRNEKEYQNVQQYIYNNPEQWLLNGNIDDEIYPT